MMKKLIIVIFASLLLGVFVNAQTDTPVKTTTEKKTETRTKPFRPAKTQVTAGQEKLKQAAIYSGATDGTYNDDFRAALKQYQNDNGLDENGKLDEATLVKMGIELTDSQKGIETAGSSSDKPKRVSFRPTKEQVAQAQKMLKASGAYSGEESGKYDNDLRAAIRDYQSANGLKRSGSLNRATLEKMGIELTESQMEIPVNPSDTASADDKVEKKKRGAVFRATKEQVTEVQQKLKTAKLYNGELDGKFSDDFRTAIKEWQKANNVKETGTLNKETLVAMGVELTDKQKEM